MKIKLIYGSDTGNTEYVIENNLLGIFESHFEIESLPINQVTPEDWNSHNFYILGIPTWYDGELQNDWEDYFDKFKTIDFTGKKVALLNFGTRLEECNKASEKLSSKGINCTIIDARFAKPLDEKLIMEVATNHEVLITIEEGSIGGFGSHVMQLLSDRGVFDTGLKFRSMILPDIFIDQDTPEKMYEIAGLDSLSIATKVEETLNSKIILAKNKNKITN